MATAAKKCSVMGHQYQALTSKSPVIFLGGGVGSGKTHTGTLWTLLRAGEATKGLIAANSYSQLYDSTLAAFYSTCSANGISLYPEKIPRSRGPLTINLGPTEILCRSLENFEMLSGVEIGFAWIDEAWQTSPDAFDLIQARLRGQGSRQCLITTTLDEPGSWLHTLASGERGPCHPIYARTAENPHLPQDYVEKLRSQYDERLFRRMVEAEWVVLSEGIIYHAFSEKNVQPCAYDPNKPILWSWDFNLAPGKPMSTCLGQLEKISGSSVLRIFDEIVIENATTGQVIDEFLARYPNVKKSDVFIYGDATGRARDTRTGKSDYDIISQTFPDLRVPKANPPVRARHNLLNSLFCSAAGESRIYIDERGKCLTKGLQTAQLKKGAGYVEDDSNPHQHVTTALGYLACEIFNDDKWATTGTRFWK